MAKDIDLQTVLALVAQNAEQVSRLTEMVTEFLGSKKSVAQSGFTKRTFDKIKQRKTFEVLMPWSPTMYGPHYAPGEIVSFLPTNIVQRAVALGHLRQRDDLKAKGEAALAALLEKGA